MTRLIAPPVSRRRLMQGSALLLGGLAMPAVLRPRAVDAAAAGILPTPDFTQTPLRYLAGARPHRTGGFRLEREELTAGAAKKYIVHNYGHSGAGITLSWGCADAVATHVKAILDALPAGTQPSVAVLGCGVIGLTSAAELLERWPSLKLTIYAKDFKLEDTTSYIAGGQFEPSIIYSEYLATPARLRVLHDTLRAARRKILDLTPKWASYGIATRRNFTLREGTTGFEKGTPLDVVPRRDLARLPFDRLNEDGREYDTWLLDPTIMLPRLIADLKGKGVPFTAREFRNKGDLAGLAETIIINCTGFGGAAISGDRAVMTPLRGQLVVLPNAQKIDYLFSGGCGPLTGYLFARTNDIVVGGTVERGRQPHDPGECRPGDHAMCDVFFRRVREIFAGNTRSCHR